MARNNIVIIGVIFILLFFIFTFGFSIFLENPTELEPVSAEHINEMYAALTPLSYLISDEMNGACSAVWNTARELDGVQFDDSVVQLALLKLKRDIPFSFEAGLFDTNNILVVSTADLGETMDIGSKATSQYTEEDFQAAGSQCIISDYSPLLNGDTGFTFTTAVYDAEGNYNGTLRVAIDTGYLFSGFNEYLRTEYGYTLWVTQDDGLVIYDKDTNEIGRNLITNELYQIPSLQTAVKNMLQEPTGTSSYLFYDNTWVNLAQTNTVWTTVYPGYGMEWRMVLSDYVPLTTPQESTLTTTPEEVKAFVENAYVYAETVGREQALAEFNDPQGDFIDGELYIFAYDMDGEALALPYQPGLIGENRWFIEDAYGVKGLQRIIARAEQGGGYVLYLYPNPIHDYAQEYKLVYVMQVDDSWLIGAGIYMQDSPLSQSRYIYWEERQDLTYQVRNLQYLAAAEGVPQVVEMVKDQTSEVQIDGLYPFVLTENGTVLAYALKPYLEGTDQLGVTNSFGMSITREIISLAQAGGGVMYCILEIPDLYEEQDVLIYVEPADATTYVGSLMTIG